jgi:hypothetical protein
MLVVSTPPLPNVESRVPLTLTRAAQRGPAEELVPADHRVSLRLDGETASTVLTVCGCGFCRVVEIWARRGDASVGVEAFDLDVDLVLRDADRDRVHVLSVAEERVVVALGGRHDRGRGGRFVELACGCELDVSGQDEDVAGP